MVWTSEETPKYFSKLFFKGVRVQNKTCSPYKIQNDVPLGKVFSVPLFPILSQGHHQLYQFPLRSAPLCGRPQHLPSINGSSQGTQILSNNTTYRIFLILSRSLSLLILQNYFNHFQRTKSDFQISPSSTTKLPNQNERTYKISWPSFSPLIELDPHIKILKVKCLRFINIQYTIHSRAAMGSSLSTCTKV